MNDARQWRDWLTLSLCQLPEADQGEIAWQALLPVSARQLYCLRELPRLPELAYLLRSPARRWLARTTWHAGRFGLLPAGDNFSMNRHQADVLQQVVPEGTGASPVLVQFGSPGPFQKVVVLSVTREGQAWVSKVAFQPAADDLLAAETSWLVRLKRLAEVEHYVPELALAGRLASGRRFLTMPATSVLPSRPNLGPLHRQFLERLCHASLSQRRWEEAPLRKRLLDRFGRLSHDAASPALAGAVETWRRIDAELRGQVMPTCIGHGDFAPWNINRNVRGITVFDWEYAQESATPLHDFFHFHCIQRVLMRRARFTTQWLNALLQAGQVHLNAVVPSIKPSLSQITHMFGLYVLDTLGMYVEAGGGFDAGDRVVASYLDCLGPFSTVQNRPDASFRRTVR
ncbi:MAG TPA: phosphotransferase [Candidatus Accumulibacter phosphatis]|nr:phosphotransferase [Candidatus Accumulibacter phosphatis]